MDLDKTPQKQAVISSWKEGLNSLFETKTFSQAWSARRGLEVSVEGESRAKLSR